MIERMAEALEEDTRSIRAPEAAHAAAHAAAKEGLEDVEWIAEIARTTHPAHAAHAASPREPALQPRLSVAIIHAALLIVGQHLRQIVSSTISSSSMNNSKFKPELPK